MHMADALLSPTVGCTMMAVSVGLTAYSIKKVQNDPNSDESRAPLMGVMGAFVFAAQMINFSIPGTGSSGHLGGGLMLAILLGPFAGFLTMASVLLIQALFFGDGGLLAYGANLFNMGFLTCFIAYPFIYMPLTKHKKTAGRLMIATVVTAIAGLQLGSFSVVLETVFSGKTDLPFGTFALFMQPIHLAIGLVEGLVTAAVIGYVWKARPELLLANPAVRSKPSRSMKRILLVFSICAVFMVVVLSLIASNNPDGLEWSIGKILGNGNLPASGPVQEFFGYLQNKTALFPGYEIPGPDENRTLVPGMADFAGGLFTFLLACGIALGIRAIVKRGKPL